MTMLSAKQERRVKERFERYMTPTIESLLNSSMIYKGFESFKRRLSFGVFASSKTIDDEVFANMVGLVSAEIAIQFEGVLQLEPPSLIWNIAAEMLGISEHDFDWLFRKYGLKKKNDQNNTNITIKQEEQPKYTYVEEKICVDEHIIKKNDVAFTGRRFICGTPMLKAKRREENNDQGWKDVTGHILTNGEVELLRKYYFVYMTPVVHKMFDDEWDIKNDFEFIASRSFFPQKPYTEREFEVHFYYNMIMPIVESLIPQFFVADRDLTEKELYGIADDILGEQDHDFDWLERTYGIRWHCPEEQFLLSDAALRALQMMAEFDKKRLLSLIQDGSLLQTVLEEANQYGKMRENPKVKAQLDSLPPDVEREEKLSMQGYDPSRVPSEWTRGEAEIANQWWEATFPDEPNPLGLPEDLLPEELEDEEPSEEEIHQRWMESLSLDDLIHPGKITE